MDGIRIGMIGCGKLATDRAKSIMGMDELTLTTVMDTNREAATRLAELTGARATTELEEVLAGKDVDAVYIATPHALHAQQAIAAAEHGKHMLVEKPLATEVEDGEGVIRACRKAGVVLSVGYQRRFMCGAQEVRKMATDGSLGHILYVRNCYNTNHVDTRSVDWHTDTKLSGGGGLFNHGTHALDILRYVTGLDVDEVYARIACPPDRPGLDYVASLALTFRNTDAIGSVEVLSCAAGGSRVKMEDGIYGQSGLDVVGTRGHVYWHGFVNVFPVEPIGDLKPGEWQQLPYEKADQDAGILADFVRAIRTGSQPRATGEDGLATVELVQAAYESGRTNRPVRLKNRHLELAQ